MNGQSTSARRLAKVLAAHAQSIMPRERGDWALAMRNEIDHVKPSRDALRWAIGCVLASYLREDRR